MIDEYMAEKGKGQYPHSHQGPHLQYLVLVVVNALLFVQMNLKPLAYIAPTTKRNKSR
jgi:hypothetical protein